MALSRSAKRESYVLEGLARFGEREGLGADVPVLNEVIEAFCAIGLGPRAVSTKGTYRSVLRAVSPEPKPRRAVGFAGSPATVPYSAAERAELLSIARSQRACWRRHSALAVVAFGIGAGLRPGEMVALMGGDVTVSGTDVVVNVVGSRPRVVPVSAPLGPLCVSLSAEAPGLVFHPEPAERSYANFVNDFCRNLTRDPGSPYLSAQRCRSSFICDHLAAGTKLSELLGMAGMAEVESLLRYARRVEGAPASKAALRHELKGR